MEIPVHNELRIDYTSVVTGFYRRDMKLNRRYEQVTM